MSAPQFSLDERQIYISGFNVDKEAIYYHKKKDRIRKVLPDVYVDSDLTQEEANLVIQNYLPRIIARNYPSAVFAMSSGYHHNQVDRKLTLAVENARPSIHLAGIDVVFLHTKAEFGIPSEIVQLSDNLGDFSIKVATDELIILQSFRRTKAFRDHARIQDVQAVAERLIVRSGGREGAVRRLGLIAKNLGYQSELRSAVDFVERLSLDRVEKKYIEELTLFWSGVEIAKLRFDGFSWSYHHKPNIAPLTFSKRTVDGLVPFFVESLIPETWSRPVEVHNNRIDLSELKKADRYIANITVRTKDDDRDIIVDRIGGRVNDFINDRGEFIGKLEGMPNGFSDDMYKEVYALCADKDAPRMSGMQVKMPAYLSPEGVLMPAINRPFTHILKLPAAGSYSTMGAVEWYSMCIAAVSGINTENFAIFQLPGIGPSFIAERFDIKERDDPNMYLTEDMCSIFGMLKSDKYKGDLLEVAGVVLSRSTNPEEDSRQLFRLVVFSWLVGNSDLHLKNIMMIKTASHLNLKDFHSIRFSPAYDVMCSMIYPNGQDPTAALSIGGERRYTAGTFRVFAKSLSIGWDEASKIITQIMDSMEFAMEFHSDKIPDIILSHRDSVSDLERVNNIINSRCAILRNELAQEQRNRKSIIRRK